MLSGEVVELIKAARNVVKLSDWKECQKCGEIYFVTSKIAVEALRQAADAAENPKLRLAPEPLPKGL